MVKYFFIGGILLLAFLTESLPERDFWRAIRRQSIPNESNEQRLFPVPYEESSNYRVKDAQQRHQVEVRAVKMAAHKKAAMTDSVVTLLQESRPLCEEERKSLDVRDLIYSSASNFIQTSNDLNLRKFHLIPRKVDVIKCVSGSSNDDSEAVCKPENCRERKVDVEVFGRLKNETGNVWEFVGTLSAVPVACECFVRWKPHKCSRSAEVYSDF